MVEGRKYLGRKQKFDSPYPTMLEFKNFHLILLTWIFAYIATVRKELSVDRKHFDKIIIFEVIEEK